MESGTQSPNLARLSGARLPADLGLSSLGLMMQLVGSMTMALMAYVALTPVFAGAVGSGTWLLFLLGSSGAVRGAFHRAAGTTLIYGGNGGPARAIKTYVVVSVIETVIWTFVLVKMGTPLKHALPTIALLLAWPIALSVIASRPRYREILERHEITQAEDLGFEGTGVFMLILGVMGTLFSGLMLMTMFKLPSAATTSPQGLLIIGVFLMLLARSAIHAHAGFKATTGVDTNDASDAAARYYSFGIISAIIAAAAILILMMMTALHPAGLLMVGIVLGGLLLWPMLLRRFYTEKNFSVLLAGSEGPAQRRAPDSGMTALGWILLGSGLIGLVGALPQLLGIEGGLMSMLMMGAKSPAGAAAHSPWWDVGIAGVQLWAGIELTQMSDRYRLAANIYGVIAAAVTLFLVWPQLKDMQGSLGFLGGARGIGNLVVQGTIAINLVVPIATVILANRKITPQATARIAGPIA